MIVDLQFNNLHGERAARLNSGQSIFPAKDPTLFMKLLSPIFLFAPHSYLEKIKHVGVDSVVNLRTWKEMLSQLTDEWKDFNLLVSSLPVWLLYVTDIFHKATVLLTTNVSFLGSQSVNNTHTFFVRQASYISILTSMGSIILGLLLTRLHRTALDVRHYLCAFLTFLNRF